MSDPEIPDDFVWLEAIDPSRNVARRYSIERSLDLFGATVVDVKWGRIGTRGQGRILSFSSGPDAERFVKGLLRRRASAPRRFGVAYRRLRLRPDAEKAPHIAKSAFAAELSILNVHPAGDHITNSALRADIMI